VADKKILIVDDEPGVREAVRTVLSREGYSVLEAADGASGVSLALRERPSLIILDVLMEPMSGWEACRILRQIEELADTPVLMLTGKLEVRDKITAIQVGANDYLPKPFRNDELKRRVERLVYELVEVIQAEDQY
jgi:DNA-binding response OmpR family regulator